MSAAAAVAQVTRLSSRVISILGLNPSPFTLAGTNTYLIGSGPQRILLDTGQGVEEYQPLLASVLAEEACSISCVLLSHGHGDHIGGIHQVFSAVGGPVPVYKAPAVGDSAHLPPLPHPTLDIVEGQRFRTEDGSATLVAHATPGHTSDSMSFVLEEEGAVFVGDCIL
jgi:ribonuclease/clavin/mitogillin